MIDFDEREIKQTTLGMRWMLLAASILVLITGVQLFVLSEATDQFFAWTIKPPLTAAFLGAAYWAVCATEVLASRRRVWAEARIAVPAVLTFTGLTLVVTLLHLDRFHLVHPDPIARIAAWAWLLVYALVPLLLIVLLVRQVRAPGEDPPRKLPLGGWVRAVLVIHAVLLLPVGIALLLVPQAAAGLWFWPLTPLTGRAIGAWLVGLGVAAIHATWENDWVRVRAGTMTYVALGALGLVVLARYPTDVDWTRPAVWIYIAVLLSMFLGGVYGWLQSTRMQILQ